MKSRMGLVILATLLTQACSTAPPNSTPSPTTTVATSSAKGPVEDLSIYNVESTWTDQAGQTLKLGQLKGQVRIVALVYTSCKGACPRLIQDMKAIEAKLSPPERARVSFVLVSIDPEVDTAEQLKKFAKEQKLGAQWRLLHGKSEDVRELAALVGFKYRKTSDTDYAHSNIITVLSSKGEIAYQQIGLGLDPAESLAAIHKQVEAQDEVMDCCKDKGK